MSRARLRKDINTVVLHEHSGPPLWRRTYEPGPASGKQKLLAQRLVANEQTAISTRYEIDLSTWNVAVEFMDVMAKITWTNPRTGAKFSSDGIYYRDNGDVLQSEYGLR